MRASFCYLGTVLISCCSDVASLPLPLLSLDFNTPLLSHGGRLMRPHGNALLTSHGLFIGPDGGMTVDLDPMRPLHTWTLLVTLKSDDSHQVQDPSVLATLHSQQGREHVSVCTTQVVAPPDQIYSAKSWVATEGGYGHGLLSF